MESLQNIDDIRPEAAGASCGSVGAAARLVSWATFRVWPTGPWADEYWNMFVRHNGLRTDRVYARDFHFLVGSDYNRHLAARGSAGDARKTS